MIDIDIQPGGNRRWLAGLAEAQHAAANNKVGLAIAVDFGKAGTVIIARHRQPRRRADIDKALARLVEIQLGRVNAAIEKDVGVVVVVDVTHGQTAGIGEHGVVDHALAPLPGVQRRQRYAQLRRSKAVRNTQLLGNLDKARDARACRLQRRA